MTGHAEEKKFDLSRIIRFPPWNYITLTTLDLTNCTLSKFPLMITQLYLLEYLNLDENRVSDIPPKYSQMIKRSKPTKWFEITKITKYNNCDFGSHLRYIPSPSITDGDYRRPIHIMQIIIEKPATLDCRHSAHRGLT